MKKVLTLVICLLMAVTCLPVSAFAASETKTEVVCETVYPHYYESYPGIQTLETLVDLDAFRAVLFQGFYNCEPVDISAFNLPATSQIMDGISSLIYEEMPECFHLGRYSVYSMGGKFTKIEPTYEVSAQVYQQMYAQLVAQKDRLLQGIQNNTQLTDVEKALLIHDRLALSCEYQYGYSDNMYNSYGALVEGKSVCQGYAEAYDYLLEQVGIDSYLCSSEQLNHVWNIVYINAKPYHVDVTWDDYAWDNGERGAEGVVGHENFLRSTQGIKSTDHQATDFDTFPNDTTYDSYFWQKSETAFQLLGNELYYIDHQQQQLKRYSDGAVLKSVEDRWETGNGYWSNQARLASDGNYLYYSQAKAVYRYDVAANTAQIMWEPELAEGISIYGFVYRDGYLICDVNQAPPYSGYPLDQLEQLRYASDTVKLPSFPDVPTNHWAYNAIEYAVEKGWYSGYASGKFGPADMITRQDFVVVLARIDGVNLKNYSGRTGFSDVAPNSYYEAAVKWASSTGVVAGYASGKFGVNDKITREQLVTILYRYAKAEGIDVSVPDSAKNKLSAYTDAKKISSYAKDAVIWALYKGVISGMTASTIGPQNTASRAQVATILMNISKKGIMNI